MLKKEQMPQTGRTVKQTNIKRVLLAVALATAGLVVFTLAAGYTYQEKQRVELNKTLQEKVQLQKVLEKNKLDSEKNRQEIERLTKELQAKKDNQARALAEASVKPVEAPRTVFTGSKVEWMSAAGIDPSNYGYVDYIISHESGWRPDAKNSIGCLGLAQACPGQKILNVCPTLDPVCQLRWATSYANRYGGWAGSYQEWVKKHWW